MVSPMDLSVESAAIAVNARQYQDSMRPSEGPAAAAAAPATTATAAPAGNSPSNDGSIASLFNTAVVAAAGPADDVAMGEKPKKRSAPTAAADPAEESGEAAAKKERHYMLLDPARPIESELATLTVEFTRRIQQRIGTMTLALANQQAQNMQGPRGISHDTARSLLRGEISTYFANVRAEANELRKNHTALLQAPSFSDDVEMNNTSDAAARPDISPVERDLMGIANGASQQMAIELAEYVDIAVRQLRDTLKQSGISYANAQTSLRHALLAYERAICNVSPE